MSWLTGLLHSDAFLKIAGALTLVAAAGTKVFKPWTIAYHVSEGIVATGVSLGLYSTTGRASKDDAAAADERTNSVNEAKALAKTIPLAPSTK